MSRWVERVCIVFLFALCAADYPRLFQLTGSTVVFNYPVQTSQLNSGLVQAPLNSGVGLLSGRQAGDNNADYQLYTGPRNASDPILDVRINNVPVFGWNACGTMFSGSNCDSPAFQDWSCISGHTALAPCLGHYLAIEGRLNQGPTAGGYWGKHGNVSVSASMDAGFLLELRNAAAGDQTDTRVLVDYRGGWGQSEAGNTFGAGGRQFHACPPTDAVGNGYGTGAAPSTLMWAGDTKHWYVCSSGSNQWEQIADTSRLKSGVVTIGGGGTATAAVAAGSECALGKKTNETNGARYGVSGTTLTVTGTAGDQVGYVCF